ncbi:MAG: M3 family metallopeptidase, partial [Flavobacteriaceae bacterium]|nr:M3 family metallopeptidase [Flavobacteriaceae bacterium]
MNNPLLQDFNTVYQTAPFSKIKNEHFKPAIEKAIAMAKTEIDAIVQNNAEPSFENTVEALEFSGAKLDRITSIFFNLNSAETNDEIQKIAQEVSPLLTEFSNDIILNEALFIKIKAVFENKESIDLNPEQLMLLDKKYKAFVRNGANLNDADKIKLRDIDKKLSKLSLTFGENVLAETNEFKLVITDEEKLKGLPDGTIEAAKLIAKETLDPKEAKNSWVFTLDYPSYIPFMTYAENRDLREKMSNAFGAKAFQENKYDNQQNVLQIVKLRHERAKLLGYKTHADFVLEERMAETPQQVKAFLKDLMVKAKPAAEKDFKKIEDLAKKDGVGTIQKWDGSYYSEKLKQQLFDLDDEKLKPYFKLENVINGVFTIAGKLYDLQFEEIFDIDKYHEEVKTYKVTDTNGDFIAVFYADFFPRKGKRNGAWM